MVSEIIKSFCKELNCFPCYNYNYIKDELHLHISIDAVQRIYFEIRNVIAKYYNIVHQSKILGPIIVFANFYLFEKI